MPCPHESFDSISRAIFQQSDSATLKHGSPITPPPPILSPPHCALGALSEVIESHPFPTCSPLRLPDSHPAIPFHNHHATLSRQPARLTLTIRHPAPWQRGEVRNLFAGHSAMALPRPTYAAGLRLSHIKRIPHTARETLFWHSRLPILGSVLFRHLCNLALLSVPYPPFVPLTPCDTTTVPCVCP